MNTACAPTPLPLLVVARALIWVAKWRGAGLPFAAHALCCRDRCSGWSRGCRGSMLACAIDTLLAVRNPTVCVCRALGLTRCAAHERSRILRHADATLACFVTVCVDRAWSVALLNGTRSGPCCGACSIHAFATSSRTTICICCAFVAAASFAQKGLILVGRFWDTEVAFGCCAARVNAIIAYTPTFLGRLGWRGHRRRSRTHPVHTLLTARVPAVVICRTLISTASKAIERRCAVWRCRHAQVAL